MCMATPEGKVCIELTTHACGAFTDVSMPGSMSGSDLARRVAERWPDVGIILASGRPWPCELPSTQALSPPTL
jgi:hypothetical protein